jgi:hypothetical protein
MSADSRSFWSRGCGLSLIVQFVMNSLKIAADFHNLQRERLVTPPEMVQLDELHGRVSPTPAQTKRGCRALLTVPIAAGENIPR